MPKYTFQDTTTGRTYSAVGDSPPTDEEKEQIVAAYDEKPAPAPAKIPASGGMSQSYQFRDNSKDRPEAIPNPAAIQGTPEQLGTFLANGFEAAAEVGLPTVVQAITAPLAFTGLTSVAGGISSGLGNFLAQGSRVMRGAQKDFETGQNVAALGMGAVPFANAAAAPTRGVIMGALSATKNAVAQGTIMGAAGVTAKNVQTVVDEGRMPTAKESVVAFAQPAGFVGGLSLLGSASGKASGIYDSLMARRKPFDAVGIEPTPGMVYPEKFGSIEGKMAREGLAADSVAGEKVAGKVDAVFKQLDDGITNVAGRPQEGATTMAQVKPLLGQIDATETTLAKLNKEANKAQIAFKDADDAVYLARATGDAAVIKTANENALARSEEAFTANLNSVAENAKGIVAAKVTGEFQALSPSEQRTALVDYVAKPLKKTWEAKRDALYAPVDKKSEVFDVEPLRAKVAEIANEIEGGLPQAVAKGMRLVEDALLDKNGEPIAVSSWQRLMNIRASLWGASKSPSYTDYERKLLREASRAVTNIGNDQAVKVLGEEGGNALLSANKFYAETKPLFDDRGTDVLFSGDPSDSYVTEFVNGMMKSGGIASDEYMAFQKLIGAIEGFDPATAQLAGQHVNELLRDNLLMRAARANPAAPNTVIIDTDDFLKVLGKLETAPVGTLEALRLGNRESLLELQILAKKYPDALKLGEGEWNALFSSPTFQNAADGQLATQLEGALAKRTADMAMIRAQNLALGGKQSEAMAQRDVAMKALAGVKLSAEEAADRLAKLRSDPVANAFNNPELNTDDFNSLTRAIFDPKASKINNEAVAALASSLSNSKKPGHAELLDRLRQHYIADRVSSLHDAPGVSNAAEWQNVDKINRFFSAPPDSATSELARAHSLLTKEQIARLEQFGEVAKKLARYQNASAIATPGASANVGRGVINAGIGTKTAGPAPARIGFSIFNAIGTLWSSGKYNIVGAYLSSPTKTAILSQNLDTVDGFINNVGAKRAFMLMQVNPAIKAELEPDR